MVKHFSFKFLCLPLAAFFFTTACGKKESNARGSTAPENNIAVAVTTIAGKVNDHGNGEDGNGASAALSTIGGIAATPDGKTIYVPESGKKVTRKIVHQ